MRKKLFAVIMSIMMMVTFMPAMAFAAPIPHTDAHISSGVEVDNVKFSDDYKTVTAELYCGYDGCVEKIGDLGVSTTRVFNTTGDNKGFVTASYDFSSQIASMVPAGTTVVGASDDADYLDLAGATIVKDAAGTLVTTYYADDYLDSISEGASWQKSTFKDGKCPLGEYVKLVQPADLMVQGQTTPLFVCAPVEYVEDLALVTITPAKYEAYEDNVELSIPVVFKKYAANLYEVGAPGVINAGSSTQKLTIKVNNFGVWKNLAYSVKKNIESESDPLLSENYSTLAEAENGEWNYIDTYYAGEDQNFQITSKGIDVEYGTWDEVGNLTWSKTAPVMKDVKMEAEGYYDDCWNLGGSEAKYWNYMFMLKMTRGTTTRYAGVELWVEPVHSAIGFTKEEFVAGINEKINNSDLIGLKMVDGEIGGSLTKFRGAYSSDLAKVKELIDSLTIIEGLDTSYYGRTPVTFAPNYEALLAKIVEDKEFAQLYFNYGMLDGTGETEFPLEMSCDVTVTNKANDVTAPNQTKTYHIKKAAKLKKNQKKFQLKATADWGSDRMTFTKMSGNSKIKVYSNGKVLVKKGLKKGTYTVKVKVKAPNAKATKTLKVKVKY